MGKKKKQKKKELLEQQQSAITPQKNGRKRLSKKSGRSMESICIVGEGQQY